MKNYLVALVSVFASVMVFSSATLATEDGKISIELNGLKQVKDSCQMTFVVQNKLKSEITDLALEVVLFDKSAKVLKFVKLGAGILPVSKTKVKRFAIAGSQCEQIGRVLVNDVARCKAGTMDPKQCMSALDLSNKSSVEQFGL